MWRKQNLAFEVLLVFKNTLEGNHARVRTGHGKPGKSWKFRISFSRPGKSWNLGVGHGKSWKMMFIKSSK